MNAPASPLRNPGPSWGYGFLLGLERWSPRWLFRLLLMAGTWVGLACMPAQRAHSRGYLATVLGRPPRLLEVWRHFFAFADYLMLKLRSSRGAPVTCTVAPENAAELAALTGSGRPAFFGSFHFGGSDLLGYLLSELGRRVTILRMRVGNSDDTRLLAERFGGQVSVLWINDPANLLFDLKTAIEAGESLALKCDRLEHSAKTAALRFLGATRLFPFTIYHLAILFNKPVVFCTAVPSGAPDALLVHASTIFTPDPAAGRVANTAAAQRHFQMVLTQLEGLVREHPFQWFNFLPLNPEAPAVS
jgi:predicted LPLAT superfamily acyltransferase